MIVCLCNPFNDRSVREHLQNKENPTKLGEVYRACAGGRKPQCGVCIPALRNLVASHKIACPNENPPLPQKT